MSLQQGLSLPFSNDFPVDVQIRIQLRDTKYQGYIQSEYSDWYTFSIQLTQHDVDELNQELQKTLEKVSYYFEGNNIDGIEHDEALLRLARKGNFAFKKIFAEGIPRDTIREALTLGAIIQVTSDDFFVPWELLYDGPLSKQVDATCFWGLRYIVSRTLIREARPGDFVRPTIPSQPRVGLIAYQGLEHVANREIPALQKLQQKKQIHLSYLRSLNSNQMEEDMVDFGRFLNEELHIVHLACHAQEKELLNESYLLISDEFSVSMEDFDVQDFEIGNKPLVLFNACRSGTISPLHTSNWAVLFWKHGARGVLATEFHVPDWFAASFVGELYDHLLAKKSIGEALFMARRHFWEQHHNPLGLGYALYARPSIRIVS